MANNYNPRTLIDRYLEEVSSLRPLLLRYINVIENIESNTSYFLLRSLRHEERMENYQRHNTRNHSRNRSSPVETSRLRSTNRISSHRRSNIITSRDPTRETAENFSRIINNLRNLNGRRRNEPALHPRAPARGGGTARAGGTDLGFLAPVPVLPSHSEIINATEAIHFRNLESGHNQTCPITQQPFHENDRIIQIIPCGHCFNQRALLRWFEQSVRCPVCRYDIREYNPIEQIRNPHGTPEPSRISLN